MGILIFLIQQKFTVPYTNMLGLTKQLLKFVHN